MLYSNIRFPALVQSAELLEELRTRSSPTEHGTAPAYSAARDGLLDFLFQQQQRLGKSRAPGDDPHGQFTDTSLRYVLYKGGTPLPANLFAIKGTQPHTI